MNKQEHIEAYEEIQDYLQKNNIHSLFAQLTQDLIIEKPENIIDFLINRLQAPEKSIIFVVGPPGLSINNLIKKLLAAEEKGYDLFNCGQEIQKSANHFDHQNKSRFQNGQLVVDPELETKIVDQIAKIVHGDKSCIIEGFPKTLSQALLLQTKKIIPKNILFVNIDDKNLSKICQQKINKTKQGDERAKAQTLALVCNEHKINLNELKQFYKQFMEIDVSHSQEQHFITHQLKKAFSIKTTQSVPRATSQVIIVGAPRSGRTTLGKKIADFYNLIYISTTFLIAEEIRKDTIHGRKIKNQYLNSEMIDSFLIEKLIEDRVSKKDCKLQGFVLEGYPKNKDQFENIKNLKMSPTLIVAIDASKEMVAARNSDENRSIESRYERWDHLKAHLLASKQKLFWVSAKLSIANIYEQVKHELQKKRY